MPSGQRLEIGFEELSVGAPFCRLVISADLPPVLTAPWEAGKTPEYIAKETITCRLDWKGGAKRCHKNKVSLCGWPSLVEEFPGSQNGASQLKSLKGRGLNPILEKMNADRCPTRMSSELPMEYIAWSMWLSIAEN